MSDGTGDPKLLALIEPSALFNFMNSLVGKHLGLAIKPNNTLAALKLASGIVVYSSHSTNGLVLNGVWQAYITLLVLDTSF